ncbi:hypothetical protein B566_EDAN002782, partial [Ephemera danica]
VCIFVCVYCIICTGNITDQTQHFITSYSYLQSMFCRHNLFFKAFHLNNFYLTEVSSLPSLFLGPLNLNKKCNKFPFGFTPLLVSYSKKSMDFTLKAPFKAPLVVVDTDPGTDDAMALYMLLMAHDKGLINLLGITCVNGNTDVDNGTRNALRVLSSVNKLEVPVYRGASEPLIVEPQPRDAPPSTLEQYHGADGFGGSTFDPEPDMEPKRAAHIVLASAQSHITLVPWETCWTMGIPYEWRHNVLGVADTPQTELLNKIEKSVLEKSRNPNWFPCDSTIAAVLICPAIVKDYTMCHLTVELHGGRTRGQVVLDHRQEFKNNVKMIRDADMEMFKELILLSVGHPDCKIKF